MLNCFFGRPFSFVTENARTMTTARIAKGASRTPRRNIVKASSGKPQPRRQSEALLAGQNRVLEGLVKGASLNAVLETLIRVIEAHSAGVIGSILVCEPGEERFGLAIAPGLPADYAALLETARTSPPFFGPCSMAVHRSETWPAPLTYLASVGFETWALTPDSAANSLYDMGMPDKVALVAGAEGPGLTDISRSATQFDVRIPLHHGVDSLNLGHALAIAMAAVSLPPA